jgi:hypothetical protein
MNGCQRRHYLPSGGQSVEMPRSTVRASYAAIVIAIAWFWLFAEPALAKIMFSFDLDSLVYMSSEIVEVDVTDTRIENWMNIVSGKVIKTYAGKNKANEQITVGLSAYSKRDSKAFGKGDHLILFLEPAPPREQFRSFKYWPVPSGLKLIEGQKVTGVYQENNPGVYVPSIDDGRLEQFKLKLIQSIAYTEAFRKDFDRNKSNTKWLLARLGERKQVENANGDRLATMLCQALAASHDQEAISKAKAMRTNHNERQILEQK